jgi:RNA polymerase sigma-54 factor
MSSLQPKLSLRVAQKQILTPGLVQMVSILALNNLELGEMIHQEVMENPVLEEVSLEGPALEEEEERVDLESRTKAPSERVREKEILEALPAEDAASMGGDFEFSQ